MNPYEATAADVETPGWAPSRWTAAGIAVVVPWVAMLYVGRPWWALVCFAIRWAFIATFYLATDMSMVGIAGLAATVFNLAVAAFAWRTATRAAESLNRSAYTRVPILAACTLLWFVLAYGVDFFVFSVYRQPSASMEPSLSVGQNLLGARWGYGHYGLLGTTLVHMPRAEEPRRGDVIMFLYPDDESKTFVKRIVGLPGETVAYRNKRLSINGTAVPTHRLEDVTLATGRESRVYEQYAETLGTIQHRIIIDPDRPSYLTTNVRTFPDRDRCKHDEAGIECVVPANAYFVMGDNRDNSDDSRYWGFVSGDKITGRLIDLRGKATIDPPVGDKQVGR